MKNFIFTLALLLGFLTPAFALADFTIQNTDIANDDDQVCFTPTLQKMAAPFTATGDASSFWGYVDIKKVLSPPSDLEVAIQADSAGVPSGIDLADVHITAASVSTSYGFVNFATTTVSLVGGTSYWLVLKCASLDGNNYYQVHMRSTSGTTPFMPMQQWNGSAWTTSGVGTNVSLAKATVFFVSPAAPVFPGAFSLVFGSAVASSTQLNIIDNPNQDVFYGFAIFSFFMSFVLWLFAKKR